MLGSGLKLPRKKNLVFADFALQNIVETTLPDGLETSGLAHLERFLSFFLFGLFFLFLIFFCFFCILGPPYCGIGATIRIDREI